MGLQRVEHNWATFTSPCGCYWYHLPQCTSLPQVQGPGCSQRAWWQRGCLSKKHHSHSNSSALEVANSYAKPYSLMWRSRIFCAPLSHSSLLVDTALHTPFFTQTSVSIIQSLCHIGLLSLLFSLPGTPSIYHGRIPQWLRVWKTLPCTSCMTIGKWISPSEPQFPHLKHGHNTSIIWLLRDKPYPVPGA